MWLLRIRIFQGLHVYVLAKLDYNDVSLWFDVVVRDMVSGNLITPGYLHERKRGRNPYIRRREKKQRTRIERREIDGQIQVWEQIPRFKKGVVTGNLAIGEEIMQPQFLEVLRSELSRRSLAAEPNKEFNRNVNIEIFKKRKVRC
ncbi:hypothetical protein VitviT2T_026502 [Vitis vinifera]|uniref:Uncharacterized protein n=1 Tax=Vitis vinifera TaxID=29760 RepID=A0ABY9DP20_VITVI|nr:hypothetical protein VitviT2T_026502 [Vitis vinifera]